MSKKVLSAAVVGLDAEIVEVEADIGPGMLGQIAIVGLPDTAVSEAKERVRSAIKNSDFKFPGRKVIVNLAPADLKKQGPSYDLPIAISIILENEGFVPAFDLSKALFVGELSLDGSLRSVEGILPIAIKAKEIGLEAIFVSRANAREAKLVKELEVFPVDNLREIILHIRGKASISPLPYEEIKFANIFSGADMQYVKGQEQAKRAMEIAASGAHNMLMSGPPGSGKTLLARTMSSILPDLTFEEALEITKIYSVSGRLSGGNSLVFSRPFRSPHHTASGVALVGGGAWPRPGEISLAHRGVLFLDEFGEFPRAVLENLRQPLEDGVINISRAAGHLAFPAKFILIAAMNPCPCGFFGDKEKECHCTPIQIINYRKKISGPILDRIDLHVEVPRVKFEKLSGDGLAESSAKIKARVEQARAVQRERFKDEPFITNSEMTSEAARRFCELDSESNAILRSAVDKMNLSPRAYFRILKLSRTIADLAEEEKIRPAHLAEALQYRERME